MPFPACHPPSRSLSALTWAMHARTEGFPLTRHTVFFLARIIRPSSRSIFTVTGSLPHAPTVYVCAQDRTDDDSGTG